jgi:hypothetical protein
VLCCMCTHVPRVPGGRCCCYCWNSWGCSHFGLKNQVQQPYKLRTFPSKHTLHSVKLHVRRGEHSFSKAPAAIPCACVQRAPSSRALRTPIRCMRRGKTKPPYKRFLPSHTSPGPPPAGSCRGFLSAALGGGATLAPATSGFQLALRRLRLARLQRPRVRRDDGEGRWLPEEECRRSSSPWCSGGGDVDGRRRSACLRWWVAKTQPCMQTAIWRTWRSVLCSLSSHASLRPNCAEPPRSETSCTASTGQRRVEPGIGLCKLLAGRTRSAC